MFYKVSVKVFFTLVIVISGSGFHWTQSAEYAITDLGRGMAYGINDNGHVVGTSNNHAFLWQSDSGMEDLGTFQPSGFGYSIAWGMNNYGQIVGFCNSGGYDRAFLWEKSTGMQDLGTLGGNSSYAHGIGYDGKIVGMSETSSGAPHAFLWQSDSGMQDLGAIGVTLPYSTAYSINNNGIIVGDSSIGLTGHAFRWQSDTGMQDLGTLDEYPNSGAKSINNKGQIIGGPNFDGRSGHAFLWQDGIGMQDLGTLGGFSYSCANGINDSEQIVGDSYTSSNGPSHAFLWESGTGMRDLNELIDPSSGWTLLNAEDINNNGQIVGYGTTLDGTTHAFLLTPVPEPSTFVLLTLAALGLLVRAWQRRRKLPNLAPIILLAMSVLTQGYRALWAVWAGAARANSIR